MSGLDARAAVFQQRLVGELRSRGVGDQAILKAFATIPRHRFVDRFQVAQSEPGARGSRQHVVDDDASDDVLELVYAPDLALLTDHDATSSLSAPYLIAGMLRELDLLPGMRVLEIGAGSGYNAALLASLVGDPELVTTMDIDADLVRQARLRLTEPGVGGVSVVVGDGDDGITGEVFDRIVATVGCTDVAPAWIEQLDTDGALLVPLVHGAAHPRIRLTKDDRGLHGIFTGYSGFVGIRGRQAGHSPWPAASSTPPNRPIVRDLPTYVAAALAPPDPARPRWNPAEWALGFYVALRDGRASLAGLDDDGSFARIERATLVLGGTRGEALGADLAALAEDWLDLGAPGLEHYETTFSPEPFGMPALPAGRRDGPWTIRRLRHAQRVELRAE